MNENYEGIVYDSASYRFFFYDPNYDYINEVNIKF